MVGKYMIEQLAGIPCEVDLASEFRYRKPILGPDCMVIPVSQSGETADTLAALREGRAQGARILSVCNVRESTIARESDDVLYTHAGPEIGVASTKAFVTQVVALYLIATQAGDRARATLEGRDPAAHLQDADAPAAPGRGDPAARPDVQKIAGATSRPRTSSSSAAASCIRSRWRGRSSSRRSPTSTPRATRRAR